MVDHTDHQVLARLGLHTFAAKIAMYAMGLVASILVARALGPEGRGEYFLPVTAVAIAIGLAHLGAPQAQIRLWSRGAGTPTEFVTANVLMTVGQTMLSVGGLGVLYWLTNDGIFRSVRAIDLAIAAIAIPFSLHNVRTGALLGINGRGKAANAALVIGTVIQTIGLVALYLLQSLSVRSVLILFVVSVEVPSLIRARELRKVAGVERPLPWSLIAQHLRLTPYFAPLWILQHLNLRIDVFFLAQMRGTAAVGIYSIAVTFAELVWLATDALTFASLEKQADRSDAQAIDVTFRVIRMNFLLAGGLATSIAIVAPWILTGFYGSEFSRALPALWILLPAAVAMSVWRAASQGLVRFEKPWALPAMTGSALLLNIVGNLLLIPRFGVAGAGISSLVSYLASAVLAVAALCRRHRRTLDQVLPGRDEIRRLIQLLAGLRPRRVDPRDNDLGIRPQ